jgi:hypothetical protein
MEPSQQTARFAGLAYLTLVVFGILNFMYIPSQLIVKNDAAGTVQNIVQSEMLFRWGVVCGVIAFLAYLVLPLLLYKLLAVVDKQWATVMVIFAITSIPISLTSMLHKFSILDLLRTPNLNTAYLQQQVMMHLADYNNGITIAQIFWGLWLLPFGYLVFRSGFLPKIFGVLLMAGCMGYLIEFFADFLIPAYRGSWIQTVVGIPASVGEIGICLWLLIMGIRKK